MKRYVELLPIGREIRSQRKAKGLSQEKLAELSGLHRNYIGGIERAERNPGLSAVLKIAEALSISPSSLLPIPDNLVTYSDIEFHITN